MIELDATASVAKLSFSPDGADPRALSAELVAQKLAEAGVCCGILDDEVAKLVDRQPQQAVKGVVVARQVEPRAGEPAPIVRILGDGQVAAKGDTIAKLGAPVAGVDGRTIFGATIKADAVPDTELIPGPNTRLVGAARLEAAIYGKVASRGDEILVESLVGVSDDKLAAVVTIHPQSAAGTAISAEMVHEALRAAGVQYGVDDEKIRTALKKSAESGEVLPRELVAAGRPGVRGDDARLEFFSEIEQTIGATREDGTLDFRERGTIRNLKAGVLICRRIAPTPGETQIDVYGLAEFPEPGHDTVFSAGENVEKRGDEFWSTSDGAVMVRDNVVVVTDVYTVPGDVDLTVGNLRHEKGALQIKGTVTSGFSLYAAAHVMVGGLVEDSTLESGGDIEIGGGVIHAHSGSILANGHVTAKFAQNAKIRAGGDISINGAAINCELRAGGRIVIAGSKARLAGGTARAVGGFRVEQLGSALGAPTRVEIDVDRRAIETIEQQIEQIEEGIGAGTATAADLATAQQALQALLDAVQPDAAVVVNGSVYPGVTVTIRKVHMSFTEVSRRCRIWLDANREMQVSPIK